MEMICTCLNCPSFFESSDMRNYLMVVMKLLGPLLPTWALLSG